MGVLAFILAASTMLASAEGIAAIPVVKEAPSPQCADLGEVRAASLLGGVMIKVAYTKALNGIKRRAQELGATHVLLIDSSSGYGGTNMMGRALRCPLPVPVAEPKG